MVTQAQLATGLGGAYGSDYDLNRNLLYFVENTTGKISVLDLIRQLDLALSQHTATIGNNQGVDLVTGVVGSIGSIIWDHADGGILKLRPQGNARFSYLGVTDFDHITQAELQNFSYIYDTSGNIGDSLLVAGAVIGVYNSYRQPAQDFDYAKVKILSNTGSTLQISWVAYRLKPRVRVLGTGYNHPEDIKLTSGGRYAYVTEGNGNFLRVDLNNANRASAQVLSSLLVSPQQIFLDEAHGQAYVPECTNTATGNLWRIDLSSGIKTSLFSSLQNCYGLLLSSDLSYAYLTERVSGANRLSKINIAERRREIIYSGLNSPFYMEWADNTQSRIILAERDPMNRISIIDLTSNPVSLSVLVNVPTHPSSIAMIKSGTMVVCCDAEIDQYELHAVTATDPLLLGIGLVPIDHIVNAGNDATDGYATTTDSSSYLISVTDAPFGGSLALMINHNAARIMGASFYKLFVNQITPLAGVEFEPRQNFGDYIWDSVNCRFITKVTSPDSNGFYEVRKPSELWYNPYLGYLLDSSILGNGLCMINIKLYNASQIEIPVTLSIHSRRVKIDNQWPTAILEKIFNNGTEKLVCSIVTGPSDQFTFRIVATDPQGHLLSWSLGVLWGDNKSATITGDDYSHHISPTRQWTGVNSGPPDVPASGWHAAVPGDSTSTRCAHTFILSVWDRVINGYGYIHGQSYHKSLTIWI